jgi:hypothetical protein
VRYWSYYRDDFDWDDQGELVAPDFALTRARFAEMGFAENEIESFVRSGYWVIPINSSVVIDRFYGGALLPPDDRTRIHVRDFKRWFERTSSSVRFYRAKSPADLVGLVDKWRSRSTRPLLFRGQVVHYALSRERPNPSLVIEGLGETSLLPSLWRRLWKARPMSYHGYGPPLPVEWQFVFRHQFSLQEIERRVAAINAAGGGIHSYQDMEDSDDPLLQQYGRIQQDVSIGGPYNLADLLNTLLQHYGLLSPVLDLTTDLEVALFFATHQFLPGRPPRYCRVGGGEGKAVIYVFRQDKREMNPHVHERVIDLLRPLRPVRQSCVVCRSSTWALNLPADFLEGLVFLDFEAQPSRMDTAHLFPNDRDDLFLAALKQQPEFAEHVTDFYQDTP